MDRVKFGTHTWHILQVGAGGTGSAVAADLARLIYSVKGEQEISYTIADGDLIEEKNILRQNFIHQDLNRNKAQVIADRYSKAYQIPIGYHDSYIASKGILMQLLRPPGGLWWYTMTIMLGCVDDNGARKLMNEAFEERSNIIWLDSGNEYTDGQVVMGVKKDGKLVLPPVTKVYPDIMEAGVPKRSLENCAAVVAEAPQAYAANKMAATVMLCFLYDILAHGYCESHMATFDSRNIMVKPRYIEELSA